MSSTLNEPHPELYSYQAAVDGDYPAVIHERGECGPCDVSAEFIERQEAENDAYWIRDQADLEAGS